MTQTPAIRIRRELVPGTRARDLLPGTVVNGYVIQSVDHRTSDNDAPYVAVFYTVPGVSGRHKKAECSWDVTAEDLFELVNR